MKNLDNFMEVGMGQSLKKAGKGLNQYTIHLRPCFGIGIHNLETDESYLGHYTDLMFYDFEKDIEKVRKDFKGNSLKIFGAGGSLEKEDLDYDFAIIQDRNYIEKIVRKNFLDAEINFQWNKKSEVINLFLNKKEKKFYVEKY